MTWLTMVYGGYNELVNGVYKPIKITTGPHSVETYRYIWINYENETKFVLQKTTFPFLRSPMFLSVLRSLPTSQPTAPGNATKTMGAFTMNSTFKDSG